MGRKISSSVELFDTYVLPITGVDFVKDMAYYSAIAEFRFPDGEVIKPRVIYCASGGCLVSYMAMMSGFSANIDKWTISADMFVEKSTAFTPRLLPFILNGFFYRRANIDEYVSRLFVPIKLQDVEIITGHYESTGVCDITGRQNITHSICLMTNMEREKSVLKDFKPVVDYVKIDFPEKMPEGRERYDALMARAIKTIQYTTNIPVLVKPLDDVSACDYGIVGSSPRTMANAKLKKTIYFSPIDIDRKMDSGLYGMFFHNYILNDILEICKDYQSKKSFGNIKEVVSFIQSGALSEYCLVMYTTNIVEMSVDRFTVESMKHHLSICKRCIKLKLFY